MREVMEWEPSAAGLPERLVVSDEVALQIVNRVDRGEATTEEIDAMFESHPVLWVRSCVALREQREVSSISDTELAERYSNGGFMEWDPFVSKQVREYLRNKGHLV